MLFLVRQDLGGFRDAADQLFVDRLHLFLAQFHQSDAKGQTEQLRDPKEKADLEVVGLHVLLRVGLPDIVMFHLFTGDAFDHFAVVGIFDHFRQAGIGEMPVDLLALQDQ